MKKIISVLMLLVIISLMLTSCGKEEETEYADTLEKIKAQGYITIALEGTWAPWCYHDESDELVGYDVEVGKYIADYLGVEAQFVEGEWDGLLAGIDSGRYDLMINGVDYTEERAEKYYFSDPYMYYNTALIVLQTNTEITCFEDLEGKNTANSAGSTYEQLAESYGATCQTVDSLDETLELVLAGRIDATINADVSFDDYMKVHPEAPLKMVDYTEECSKVVMPMRKVDESLTLQAEVNKAIAEMKENGTLAELGIKYFDRDHSSEG